VVAHIHYVLIGINLFPVCGGIYFWFPKWSGRMLSERLGRWNFWLMFAGFNIAFLPMHLTGLWGMPRRVYTYPDHMGWNTLNLITSLGAFLLAAGVLVLLANVALSLRRGERVGANPWDAYTLEWAIPSPPPSYNFVVLPHVASRHPLWEERLGETENHSVLREGLLLDHGKEALAVSPLDGQPELILKMCEDSLAPFLLTLAMTVGFVGLLAHAWWAAAAGGVGIVLALFGWLWPSRELAIRAGAVR
jgi:cytochrome c oxidase subunit 1/cytochrome c oxidase subunit I+III